MRDLNRKALIYSAVGILLVLSGAFVTELLAPRNRFGEVLRFSIPVLIGILAGGTIFLRLKQESDIDFDDLEKNS